MGTRRAKTMSLLVYGWAFAVACAEPANANDSTMATDSAGMGGDSRDMGKGDGSSSMGDGTGAGDGSDGSSGDGSGGTDGEPSGGDGDGTSAGDGGDMTSCMDAPAFEPENLISDFEMGTGAVNQENGRGGGFYMFNDGTEGATQTPAPGALPDAREESRCDSLYALCMSGSGFTAWGAGMGTDLAPTEDGPDGQPVKATYDLSKYRGIGFWAKVGEGATKTLRISFKDGNTAPEGGQCDAKVASGAEACNDDWGITKNFGTSWKYYEILFEDIRQGGWGKEFTSFAQSKVYSIQFQVQPKTTFDFCIDDVVLLP